MIKSFFTLLLLYYSVVTAAQLSPAALLPVPEELKKNAHSVKREENIELEIKSPSKVNYSVHQVTTILDEGGNDELEVVEYVDKFTSLDDVKIELYDAAGKFVKGYGKKELISQLSGEGLVPDGKVYYLKVPAAAYPVTLVVNYTLKFNGLCHYPGYEIQLPEQSTENAMFTAKVPADLDLRYKLKNTTTNPVVNTDGKYKIYTWTFKNIPALKYEEGSVSKESRYPKIILAPNRFELDGYAGDMTSWENFGKWYGDLAKDAANLSDERKQQLLDLVKNAATDKEKIKIIYQRLQQNFRYVSIQLGIGGFKPFEADFVDKKKYGDCKALSNYAQACLTAIGIKSYQALINAEYNREPVDPGFPNNSFNHVILCVPLQNDSVWLECTSSTNDFGVLGNFTENRNALLITETGGKLVPTPRSKATDNLFNSNSVVSINDDATGSAMVKLNSTGEYKQDFMHYIANEKKDDQKRFLVQYLGFINPDEFEITHDKTDLKSETEVKMQFEKIPDFTAGSKFFISPRIYKIWPYGLPKAEGRTQDFYFQHPFVKTDTTIYKLPAGFTVETLPKQRTVKFESGTFFSSYIYNEKENTITTTAQLILNNYRIPAAKFLAAKQFFNEVLEEYSEKIVIKRSN